MAALRTGRALCGAKFFRKRSTPEHRFVGFERHFNCMSQTVACDDMDMSQGRKIRICKEEG